ncbi:MAG: SGNH/GDSL hydrolase family protein [Abditibacteriales bacterium]|nr:SGNH/GDSL hydrolase family protein [Abditibacteriales bacterium]MDW8367670.1 SGNH/GDSL hydrolase family protein [Abditibacteriales bacterium]
MKFERALQVLWGLMGLVPLTTLLVRGAGKRFITTGLIYLLGWGLLWLALRRDPQGKGLQAFGRSSAAQMAGAGVALLLAILSVGVSLNALGIAFSALATGFFALWAICRTGEALTKSVENLLLMACSVGVMLLVGEMIFRLPPVVARTGGNTPGMARWAQTHYDEVVMKGNALRLRSLHLEKFKPSGVFRIVTLGDSYTWGDKIPRTQDIWPYVVERSLRQKGYRVEVVNMGKNGFTTVNEAELLERVGWSFDPDLIILNFTLNDTLPSGPNYFSEPEEWYFRTRPLSPIFHRALDRHSYLYSFLNAQVRMLQIQSRYPDGYAPLYAEDFEGWRACRAALRAMGEKTRERGVPMLVVIFPSLAPPALEVAAYPYVKLHQKIAAAAREAGLSVLDLRPVYARFGRSGRSWWALPCDAHPNVEGHKVAGEAIAKKVETLGVLPKT